MFCTASSPYSCIRFSAHRGRRLSPQSDNLFLRKISCSYCTSFSIIALKEILSSFFRTNTKNLLLIIYGSLFLGIFTPTLTAPISLLPYLYSFLLKLLRSCSSLLHPFSTSSFCQLNAESHLGLLISIKIHIFNIILTLSLSKFKRVESLKTWKLNWIFACDFHQLVIWFHWN